jgi:hypothetical protein
MYIKIFPTSHLTIRNNTIGYYGPGVSVHERYSCLRKPVEGRSDFNERYVSDESGKQWALKISNWLVINYIFYEVCFIKV